MEKNVLAQESRFHAQFPGAEPERHVSIIGVSIGNPFFTKENIERLCEFSMALAPHCYLFVADASARHTFEALGYSPEEAKRKARLRGNALRNKFQELVSEGKVLRYRFEFVDWSAVESHYSYKLELNRVAYLYSFHSQFRQDAELATQAVLTKRTEPNGHSSSLTIGIRFLLEELAFLLAARQILSAAVVNYVYHRPWPIFEKLLRGLYDQQCQPEIKYVLFDGAEHASS